MKEEYFFREGTHKSVIKKYIPDMQQDNIFVNDFLRFVGILILVEDKIIYCYPKYMEQIDWSLDGEEINKQKSNIKEHLKKINKVIDLLRQKGREIENLLNEFAPEEVRKKEALVDQQYLSKFIIEDYIAYNIFEEEEDEDDVGSVERASWKKTIKSIMPVHIDDLVVYDKAIVEYNYVSNMSEISQIHRNVINQCLRFQKSRGNFDNIAYVEGGGGKTGTREAYVLYNKMQSEFRDRENQLLRALYTWVNENSIYYNPFGGTTNFQGVWEWVNDDVFGNTDRKASKVPEYWFSNGQIVYGLGDSRPDTLFVDNENNTVTVRIYDSKYYVAKKITRTTGYGEEINTIDGWPANSDIRKQVDYRRGIEQDARKKGLVIDSIENIFLFPTQRKEIREAIGMADNTELLNYICSVKQGEFDIFDYKFETTRDDDQMPAQESTMSRYNSDFVDVLEVNPDILYDLFLQKKHYYEL